MTKMYPDESMANTVGSSKHMNTFQKHEIMSKYATVMDLPREMHDQLISYWVANDFGSLADFAESEGSLSIAAWARGWFTAQ